MTLERVEISIIIRTFNEERWIGHCLQSMFKQDFGSFEVILVDNNSSDHTVEIAKRYPIAKIVKIDKFLPGKAINDGVRASNGRYIVCISAHCIPVDDFWLKNLYKNLHGNPKAAGVYGRQLPLSYTSDADKRDLLISFGQDRKVQAKDFFFHNANSMVPREIWERIPFDEEVTNIEDRVWGKAVVEAGFEIIYEPDAPVYHYHGLHQHGSTSDRAKGIAKILDKLDGNSIGDLPDSLKPENICVAAVILLNDSLVIDSLESVLLMKAIDALKESGYVNVIYLVSHDESIALATGVDWVDRSQLKFESEEVDVEQLLSQALIYIESLEVFPEVILYVNHQYAFRPNSLFDELVTQLQFKGLSAVFPCFIDYGHYWKKDPKGAFIKADSSMSSRDNRESMMRALYGLGCATSSAEIRKGSLTGGNVGIFSIDDYRYTLNVRENGAKHIIKRLMDFSDDR